MDFNANELVPSTNKILRSAYDNTCIQFALQKKFSGKMNRELKISKLKKFQEFLQRKVEKWKAQINEQTEKEEQEYPL